MHGIRSKEGHEDEFRDADIGMLTELLFKLVFGVIKLET